MEGRLMGNVVFIENYSQCLVRLQLITDARYTYCSMCTAPMLMLLKLKQPGVCNELENSELLASDC